MTVYPCIKVNLGLNVLRKRPDGYHDLETLFVPSGEYHDVLEIIAGDDWSRTSASLFSRYAGHEPSSPGSGEGPLLSGQAPGGTSSGQIVQAVSDDGKLMVTIARKEGVGWNPLEDLCAKAYFLLDRDFSLPPAKIFLEKLSPVGAGLGGGSADAAFAIKEFDRLFSIGLDDAAMSGYASRLGSDCAFFMHCRPMFGEGRGDVLSDFPVPCLDRYELKVVVPEGISVSTADAYRGIVPRIPAVPLKEILRQPVETWRDMLTNDFEETVFAKYPALAAIKRSLYDSGAVYASMSGSGSALFALYPR
ncbi:MAG: 4-(cytidine 5'-diphospho)-2-C-methyl-D-erythritol kinase [Bacteroidetes bacterium]|uniref:4-diphosphocytidyl-2-C-methyl-D-erythritol kinase n=1 Tax=Candidatus Cryptobacteroides excrementavium TaxID=2840759 RepID=A0A9D9J4C3_9BACT|nr:4-(cytidine 5'-diphospho)-2-C-methyl-D-erythritol kinase [Candidatus Cryptobacteroides excrementavium]